MTKKTETPEETWTRLKKDTTHAVDLLHNQLQMGETPQDMFDAYLYAKLLLAEAMQAYLQMQLPERCETFHDLRHELGQEMIRRYDGRIPEKYLKVPYGGRTYEQLFTVLLLEMGRPVQAAMLRIVTADAVHAERRVRELRELGLDIDAREANERNVYTLNSLELDTSKIPTIIKNLLRDDKTLTKDQRDELRAVVDG